MLALRLLFFRLVATDREVWLPWSSRLDPPREEPLHLFTRRPEPSFEHIPHLERAEACALK